VARNLHAQAGMANDIEKNKDIARRFVDEVFVQGRAETVDEIVSPEFQSHSWPSTGDGRNDVKQAIKRVSQGLADIAFEIEDMVAENDKVAVRVTASARQVGEFMRIPPSGKSYKIGEIHIFRIADGQIAEHWDQIDTLGLMQQLGAQPAPKEAAAART
jgi:steroid delta-isomerase-like uncharacterized protein